MLAGSAVPSLLLAATYSVTALGCKVQDPAAWLQATTVILALLALEGLGNLCHAKL